MALADLFARGPAPAPETAARTAFLVIDTESVPDGRLLSAVKYPGENVSPEEAIERARAEQRETSWNGSTRPSAFSRSTPPKRSSTSGRRKNGSSLSSSTKTRPPTSFCCARCSSTSESTRSCRGSRRTLPRGAATQR